MKTRVKIKITARAVLLTFVLAVVAVAAGDWVIFKGQVNGPVANPGGIALDSFRLKHYPGAFWDEGYFHQINFPDGAMLNFSISFSRSEATCALVYAKPGQKPFKDLLITDIDEAKFDDTGFGFSIGPDNRVRLEGSQYTLDLNLPQTKARIVYDIIGPSYTFGDGLVRYPDGKTYMFYSMPISWAKVRLEGVLDGKALALDGWGDMNHDAGVIFTAFTPARWRVFWLFGSDHALTIRDCNAHPDFNGQLFQQLIFVDQQGRTFTSTSYPLQWDDWADPEGIPLRYPKKYTLRAEGQGETLELEVRLNEVAMVEDLFSNLPAYLRLVAERLSSNCWTVDACSEYTLTYRHDGVADVYQGKGIVRWTNLEEKEK